MIGVGMEKPQDSGVRVQTVDLGSSSLKLASYEMFRRNSHVTPERMREVQYSPNDIDRAKDAVLDELAMRVPDMVSHRIVFGSDDREGPVLATPHVLRELEGACVLEPLHLPGQVALVRAIAAYDPSIPQLLCFDTAFYRRMPAVAQRAPLPDGVGAAVKRFGYHGLSYEYVTSVLGAMRGRMVIAHLGSGASLCALVDGRPVDTTMGFSPLGGLMMATRPGDLDPGALLYLLKHEKMDAEQLTTLLYSRSGLLGVSGKTGDMRELLRLAPSDGAAARAIELFVYQLRKNIGAMVAVIGGLDTLVFTGGIGENCAEIRAKVCEKLGYLGVNLLGDSNQKGDAIISANASGVTVWIIHTNESLMLARHAFDAIEHERRA